MSAIGWTPLRKKEKKKTEFFDLFLPLLENSKIRLENQAPAVLTFKQLVH